MQPTSSPHTRLINAIGGVMLIAIGTYDLRTICFCNNMCIRASQ